MDYEVKARRYDTGVIRYQEGGFQASFRRYLRLYDLVQVQGDLGLNALSGVTIAFFDQPPSIFGTFSASVGIVNVKAPICDFGDMYRMVQTEAPIFFRWTEAAVPGQIALYAMHADYEPIGEGLTDNSP
jgi:hypothetical protein